MDKKNKNIFDIEYEKLNKKQKAMILMVVSILAVFVTCSVLFVLTFTDTSKKTTNASTKATSSNTGSSTSANNKSNSSSAVVTTNQYGFSDNSSLPQISKNQADSDETAIHNALENNNYSLAYSIATKDSKTYNLNINGESIQESYYELSLINNLSKATTQTSIEDILKKVQDPITQLYAVFTIPYMYRMYGIVNKDSIMPVFDVTPSFVSAGEDTGEVLSVAKAENAGVVHMYKYNFNITTATFTAYIMSQSDGTTSVYRIDMNSNDTSGDSSSTSNDSVSNNSGSNSSSPKIYNPVTVQQFQNAVNYVNSSSPTHQ